jgi:hypothetical protein
MAVRREDGCRPWAEGIGIRDERRGGGGWFVEVGSVVLFGDGVDGELLGMLVSVFWLLLALCIWDLSTVS